MSRNMLADRTISRVKMVGVARIIKVKESRCLKVMFHDAPSGRNWSPHFRSTPASFRSVGGTAERNIDIILRKNLTTIVKMPALKFVRSVSSQRLLYLQ